MNAEEREKMINEILETIYFKLTRQEVENLIDYFEEKFALKKSEWCRKQREVCKKYTRDKCYDALGIKKMTYGQLFNFIEEAPEPEDENG